MHSFSFLYFSEQENRKKMLFLLVVQFILILGTCSTQNLPYNIPNFNGRTQQHQAFNLTTKHIDDYRSIQHTLRPFELAKILNDVHLKESPECYSALLKLVAPIVNITHWTPAAALSLLGQPIGRGYYSTILLINTFFFHYIYIFFN